MDVFVTKHDQEGRQVWTRLVGTAGAAADDYAQGLVADDDGTVYVGAKNASAKSVVVKFDNCGTKVWSIDVGQMAFGSELHVSSTSLSNNKSYVSCFHVHGSSVWSYDMRLGNDTQVTGIGFYTGNDIGWELLWKFPWSNEILARNRWLYLEVRSK